MINKNKVTEDRNLLPLPSSPTAVAMVPSNDRNICSVAKPTRMQHRILAEDRRKHSHTFWKDVFCSCTRTPMLNYTQTQLSKYYWNHLTDC